MKIEYANAKVAKQCSNLKEATKLFGGDKKMAVSLLSRINLIQNAEVIKDIILTPQLRFHKLSGNRKGYFAIDVKTVRDKWRVILCPLNDDGCYFDPCNINEIAARVRIIEISEVSPHYE